MEARAAVGRLWPGQPAVVTPLTGGITNHNFRVDVGGESFVLRMGGADTNLLGIDRRVEHAASLRAAQLGIGPPVVGFIEPEGWLVTRFLGARPVPPSELRGPATLRRVATALRRLHDSGPIPGRFDAHEVVEEYRLVAAGRGVAIPAHFELARELAERIRTARGPQPAVPCHNDLLNANFLDDGELRIVDWEYAGMGDRFFDLANLSVNHDFGLAEDRLLLAAYFGVEHDADLASLRLMRCLSDFREAMWGVVQSGISKLDFDFDAYAAEHFERLVAAAADPELPRYLAACQAASGANSSPGRVE